MADNVTANAGSGGAVFRTDEVSVNVHVPYTKLMSGTDGATDLIPGDAANGLDVDVTRLPALPAGTNNIGDVDVLTLPALPAGANTIGAVNLAQYTPASGRLPVDPSGVTSPISAASLPLPTGAATEATLSALNTKVATAKTSDYDTGAGTDTVPMMGLALPASGGAVQGGTATNPVRVDPTGTTTQPVSLASVPSHAVTNAGTFAVQESGAALTALQLIDNLVLAEDSVAGSGDPGVAILAVRRDAASAGGADGDYVNLSTDSTGALRVTGGGGGTQYAEDAAHTTGDTGTMALGVRRDANTSLVGTDGDYAPFQVDANGGLKVSIIAGAGSGGTASTDDGAFTVGSGSGTPIMGLADETTPDAVDEGDVGVVRMTLQRGLHVNLRDASGNEVSVGGGTQYDEDTAHVSGDKLTMAGVVRRDTAASGVGADGDRDTLSTDNTGRLWVNGSGVTQPISAASLPLPTGAATAANQTTGNTSLGTIAGAVAGTEMQVDVVAALPAGNNNIGDVDVASLVPGTGATNLGKAEDAAHTTGDVGVMALAVRNDTRGALAGTDGDYAPLQLNASGDLRVDGSAVTQPISAASLPLPTGAATAANQSTANTSLATIAGAVSGTEMQVDVLTLPNVTLAAGTNTNEVVGDAAHDAAIAGNPVRQGLRAMTADFAAVATGDTVDALATINGKQVVLPHALPGETWAYAAAAGGLVNTTGVTAKAAAGAGIRNYVSSIQVINSHATISTEVVVRDGAAGTVLHRGWAQAAGGGYACKFDPPLRGTANTLVEIAEVTATATAGVLVSLQGYEAEE